MRLYGHHGPIIRYAQRTEPKTRDGFSRCVALRCDIDTDIDDDVAVGSL